MYNIITNLSSGFCKSEDDIEHMETSKDKIR